MAPRNTEPAPGVYPIDTGTAELSASGSGWLVCINGAESSHIDPDHPERLDFEYMRQMALIVEERFSSAPRPPRALHLGAATCALPRYLDHRFPGARQVAVEIDAALAAYAREWFDLPRAPALRIRVGDARAVVDQVRGEQIVVAENQVDRPDRRLQPLGRGQQHLAGVDGAAVAATAGTNAEMYSIADGIANKLFVAYAAYTK